MIGAEMKIAAMGAGALGGYFGGRLASAGHDVTLIARGAHLNALRRNGLKILSPKGDLHIGDIVATSDPGEVGPVDVILFMVKNYDVADAARQIEPMIGPQTMCVTCQNGVSAPDRLADVVGAGHVVPGVAMIPAEVLEPGVIRHNGPLDTLRFGELDGTTTTRASAFATALEQGGCTADILPNIAEALWRKLVMQATLASVTTLLRLDLGPIRENPETAALCRAGITETFAVAHRLHVQPAPDGPRIDAGRSEPGQAAGNRLSQRRHRADRGGTRRTNPDQQDVLAGASALQERHAVLILIPVRSAGPLRRSDLRD